MTDSFVSASTRFELTTPPPSDGATRARTGVLTVAHGTVETPQFMPVGTNATVKALSPDDIEATGATIILANTYHLYLRPGHERIARLGRGYTYCVARAGVTGSGEAPRLAHGKLFAALAGLGAAPPVLGFGISSPDHVRAASAAGAASTAAGSTFTSSPSDTWPSRGVVVCTTTTSGASGPWKSRGTIESRHGT